jgi:CheY-like chemotaxis protein
MASSSLKPAILVVEDQPLVRMFLADLLDEHGFRVVEATNADEALVLFQARPDVAAVITDVEMPGSMDGYELARTISEHSPSTGIIISSGRSWPGSEDIPDGAVFLPKPVNTANLIAQVQEAAARTVVLVPAAQAAAQMTINLDEDIEIVQVAPSATVMADPIVVEAAMPAQEPDR